MTSRKLQKRLAQLPKRVELLPEAAEWAPGEARTMASHVGEDPVTWVVDNLTNYREFERGPGPLCEDDLEAADLLFLALKEAVYDVAPSFLGSAGRGSSY
jgi:hypothetical protein